MHLFLFQLPQVQNLKIRSIVSLGDSDSQPSMSKGSIDKIVFPRISSKPESRESEKATSGESPEDLLIKPKYRLNYVQDSYTDAMRSGCPSKRVYAKGLMRKRLKHLPPFEVSGARNWDSAVPPRKVKMNLIFNQYLPVDATKEHDTSHGTAEFDARKRYCRENCDDPDKIHSLVLVEYAKNRSIGSTETLTESGPGFTSDEVNDSLTDETSDDLFTVKPWMPNEMRRNPVNRKPGFKRRAVWKHKKPLSLSSNESEADGSLFEDSGYETSGDTHRSGIKRIQVRLPVVGKEETFHEDEAPKSAARNKKRNVTPDESAFTKVTGSRRKKNERAKKPSKKVKFALERNKSDKEKPRRRNDEYSTDETDDAAKKSEKLPRLRYQNIPSSMLCRRELQTQDIFELNVPKVILQFQGNQ